MTQPKTLRRPRFAALQLLYNFIADRLHLTLIRTRGDHEKIREAGNSAQIEHGQINRLLFRGRLQGPANALVDFRNIARRNISRPGLFQLLTHANSYKDNIFRYTRPLSPAPFL